MLVNKFNPEDYNEISSWWTKQDWPAIPLQMLSDSGFIVEEDGVKIAATWIFKTNSPIYLMEWTVANPDISWDKRSEGLELITNEACKWAKKNGAASVFTMTKHERFIDKLKDYGFQVTDSGMTHLIRSL